METTTEFDETELLELRKQIEALTASFTLQPPLTTHTHTCAWNTHPCRAVTRGQSTEHALAAAAERGSAAASQVPAWESR